MVIYFKPLDNTLSFVSLQANELETATVMSFYQRALPKKNKPEIVLNILLTRHHELCY